MRWNEKLKLVVKNLSLLWVPRDFEGDDEASRRAIVQFECRRVAVKSE